MTPTEDNLRPTLDRLTQLWLEVENRLAHMLPGFPFEHAGLRWDLHRESHCYKLLCLETQRPILLSSVRLKVRHAADVESLLQAAQAECVRARHALSDAIGNIQLGLQPAPKE